MLASSFWQEREREIERDRETLALSSMATPRIGCFSSIGNIQESMMIEVTRFKTLLFLFVPVTLFFSFFLLHLLNLSFLLWIFLSFLSNERLLFWLFSYWNSRNSLFFGFLIANSSEKVGPASLYKWKTVVPLVAPLSRHFGSSSERLEGFSFFKVQIFRPCSRSYF